MEDKLFGKIRVEMKIRSYGTIKLDLDADEAPITVENFIGLVRSHFYDNLSFHRIIPNFMIQGGDPTGTGMGGSSTTIKGEFKDNGVDNYLKHTRGAISMARLGSDYDSASSQFFIVHKDSSFLDGEYAVFGYVTEGIEVVDKIVAASKPIDNDGTIVASEQPVITSIEVIE